MLKRIRSLAFGDLGLENAKIRRNGATEARDEQGDDSTMKTAVAAITVAAWAQDFIQPSVPHLRRPNAHRDRPGALEFIRSWDDTMFQRQMRVERGDFGDILEAIAPLIEKNEEMARRSSGSAISPEILLAMTLRLLAGANYLDLIWYQVSVDHVWEYVTPVLVAIHNTINNVTLPSTEAELDTAMGEWKTVSALKYGGLEVFSGVAAAVDGFVIERTRPTQRELKGQDYRMYLNRAGFFAWVACAMVGAYCQFFLFELRWPGATNDCTAFEQSAGLAWLHWLAEVGRGVVPGDDAYSSIHERLLTPFTKKQLRKARENDMQVYYKMRAFNKCLSSERITVERAFGILVRRFGCLWSAFERSEKEAFLMVIVCVKLHNICVHRWRSKNPSRSIPEVPVHCDVPDDVNTVDEEITERLENKYVGAPCRAKQNSIRLSLCEHIHRCGIEFQRDDDFLVDF